MLSFAFLLFVSTTSKIVNDHVERTYKINQNLITVTVTARFTNQGKEPINEYAFSVTPREGLCIGKTTASFNEQSARSFLHSLSTRRDGDNFYVNLGRQVIPDETVTLVFVYTLGDYFRFLRQTIQLNQKIGLYFSTSKYYLSNYQTTQSKITIEGITKSQILSKPNDPDLKVQTNQISIHYDQSSISASENTELFEIEFTTSGSLPRIDEINSRTVVSHWGKTKQSAFYSITNAGPKFVGEFNRIDFTPQSPCFLQNLNMVPPKGAYNFWADDESGQLQKEMNLQGNNLEIPLRGPMLSSWKATFTVGWTMNTDTVISGHYRYNAPLLTPFIAAPVSKASAEIILPEGAQVTRVSVPVWANFSELTEVHNLDLHGRLVIRIEAEQLASKDIIPITIEYTLDYSFNFLKILLLGAAFSVIFCGIAISRRIDLSITV